MRRVNPAWVAEMFKRMRNRPLEESAIFNDLAFNLFPVVERPLMPVGVELDVDARFSEVAELLFIHNPEQLLSFNLVKGDGKRVRRFFQKRQAIGGRQ